jgi:predicted ester cyclase
MSAEEIKALERRYFEVMNNGKAAAMTGLDEDCAPNFVIHNPFGMDLSLKVFKQQMSELCDAFPDIHFTLDDMVVEGDKAAMRYTWTGTHKGMFMGIPPTNRKVTVWGIEIDRIDGGKIAEAWVRLDILGLMQQLGAVPTPAKGK